MGRLNGVVLKGCCDCLTVSWSEQNKNVVCSLTTDDAVRSCSSVNQSIGRTACTFRVHLQLVHIIQGPYFI